VSKEQIIMHLGKLIEGLGVPRSLGLLGAATEPYDKVRDGLRLHGWTSAEEAETALRELFLPE